VRTGERRFGVDCWYLRALRRARSVHAAEARRYVLGSDPLGRNAGIYERYDERGARMQRRRVGAYWGATLWGGLLVFMNVAASGAHACSAATLWGGMIVFTREKQSRRRGSGMRV